MEDMKRSWERQVHLKKLRALAKEGPAAIREYAVRLNSLLLFSLELVWGHPCLCL